MAPDLALEAKCICPILPRPFSLPTLRLVFRRTKVSVTVEPGSPLARSPYVSPPCSSDEGYGDTRIVRALDAVISGLPPRY